MDNREENREENGGENRDERQDENGDQDQDQNQLQAQDWDATYDSPDYDEVEDLIDNLTNEVFSLNKMNEYLKAENAKLKEEAAQLRKLVDRYEGDAARFKKKLHRTNGILGGMTPSRSNLRA